jgi:hypothetical protein
MDIHELILPEDMALPAGAIFKVCGPVACEQFKVMRVRLTAAGAVHRLAEVAGSLAVDPMIVYYEQRLAVGDLPKVARAKACKRFKLKPRQFFNRKAAR